MSKRGNNGGVKVSAAAWNAALNDFNARFSKIEKQLAELASKIDSKVNVSAWNKVNAELTKKVKSKVNVKAWENSLVDQERQFNKLALSELRDLDDRLDKTAELITNLTSNINDKVNVSAWDRLCTSNEQLIQRVDKMRNNQDSVIKRLSGVENLLDDAKVSEQELKKLLESI